MNHSNTGSGKSSRMEKNKCVFLLTKASWNQEFNFFKGTIFRFAVQF
jgi:hypothetical protein